MNLNKALIIGRITQPLELKKLPSGNSVVNFSVATNYVYKDQNGNKVELPEFHNIVAFGKQAENIAQYFVKGQEIFVEGRIQTRSWDDKETGKKMYRTEIILDKFEFGQKPGNSSEYSTKGQEKPEADEINYPEEDISPDDIPF